MAEVFATKEARDIRPGNVVCVGTDGRYMVTRRTRPDENDEVVLTMSDVNSVLRIVAASFPWDFPITTVISEDI